MDPINIPPMLAYIAYMDPMGNKTNPFIPRLDPCLTSLVSQTSSNWLKMQLPWISTTADSEPPCRMAVKSAQDIGRSCS